MSSSNNSLPIGKVGISEAMDRALACLQEGRFNEAENIYRKVLAAEPNHLHALMMQGIALEQLGKLPQAIKSFRKALKKEPHFADARYNLGNLYLRAEDPKKAKTCYQVVCKQAPDFAPAHNNLGLALMRLQQFKEAETCFKRALELEPGAAHVLNNLGNLYGDSRKPDLAEACYRQAIDRLPEYTDAHVNLGKLFNDTGRYEDATTAFKNALSLSPDHADAHNNLAIALRESGNFEEATHHARQAIRLDPEPAYPYFILGKLLEQGGEPAQAIEAYRSCLERDASDSFGAALCLAHLGATEIPEEAPKDYLHQRYAKKARTWDTSVEGDTPYRGPKLVVRLLEKLQPDFAGMDILDAGCGTGLIGMALKGRAGSLVGVDLSAAMLEKAAEKKIYDTLHEGDLIRFLHRNAAAYDVLLSAATLIYFGDLHPVFEAAAKALRPGGLFIFTAFPSSQEDISVTAFSCYAHSESYLHTTAETTGFRVEALETDIHEYKEGAPVDGFVVGLRSNYLKSE